MKPKHCSYSDLAHSRFYIYRCGAEGFGKTQPISYQVQGPCRGGRNARGRTKGIQTARIYCRG